MKKLFVVVPFLALVVGLLAMSSGKSQTEGEYNCKPKEGSELEGYWHENDELIQPFDLSLDLETNGLFEHYLVVSISPEVGSMIASPYSNNDWNGLFRIDQYPNENLDKIDAPLESPMTVETTDKISGDKVNWIKSKTTYRQKIRLQNHNNFDQEGRISFTVEPSCNRWVIPFTITHQSGSLKIWKGKSQIRNLNDDGFEDC